MVSPKRDETMYLLYVVVLSSFMFFFFIISLQLLVDEASERNICELGLNVFLSTNSLHILENIAGYHNACELSVNEDLSVGGRTRGAQTQHVSGSNSCIGSLFVV